MMPSQTVQRAVELTPGAGVSDRELGLGDYARILWRRRLVVVGVTLVCGIAAFFISRLATPAYEASVLLSITPSKLSGDPNVSGVISSFRTLTENRALARAAIDELGLGRPPYALAPAAFLNNVAIDEVPRTNFVRLRVRLANADLAAKAANLVAERAIVLNRRINDQEDLATRDFIRQQLEDVSARVSRLRDNLVEYRRGAGLDLPQDTKDLSVQRGRLRAGTVRQKDAELAKRELEYDLEANLYLGIAAEYEHARIRALAQNAQLTIVDPAVVPERPVSPRPGLNAAVAATLGLILAIACVVAYELASARR